jgi:hypothetical protein
LIVQHRTYGEHDFIASAKAAIHYWMARRGLSFTWDPQVAEAAGAWTARIDVKLVPHRYKPTDQVRFRTYKRDAAGELVLTDVPLDIRAARKQPAAPGQ